MNNKLAKIETPKQIIAVADAVSTEGYILLTRSYRLILGSSKLERDFIAAEG